MINIAITQRISSEYDGREIRESLDVRWYEFMKSCGFFLIPISVKHDILQFLQKMEISGIVLSGGNDLFSVSSEDINKIRDTFERKLLQEAIKANMPVIGVCHGMQQINNFFGGSLQSIKNHVAISHEIRGENLRRSVNSFHNYAVKNIPEDFEADYVSYDGIIEAFHHKYKSIYAVMWHPEREKIFQLEDIKLFQKIFEGKNEK